MNYDKVYMIKMRTLNCVEAWTKHKISKEHRHGSSFSVAVVCHSLCWDFGVT